MPIATRLFLGLGVAALLLASCGRREAPPAPPGPPPPAPPVEVQPLSSADYVASASSIDLLIVQAADLATTRAGSGRLRDLAAMLRRDHVGVAAQLSFAGRRLNLLPSATLQVRHQAMFDALAAAPDFDAAWKRTMVAVHEQGVRVHGDFARAGTSPTLRPVAAFAAPAMRRHLDALRGL